MALEARGLGSASINVRITAVRKLAVEAADNGLLAPELAAGITRVKGAKSTRRANGKLAQRSASPETPERTGRDHQEGTARPGDAGDPAGLRAAPV